MKLLNTIKLLFLLLFSVEFVHAQSIDLPVNFQNPSINYGLTDFGGNASSIGNDLLDSTNRVGIVTKSNTAELWAGTTLGGTTGFATAIAFAPARTIITMRVYSPDSGIVVKLKVEDPTDGTKSVETDTRTTVANAWQTLSFNFATQATGTAALNYNYVYKKASVFFNFGVTGAVAGAKTYYFDDMIFAPAVAPLIDLPVNFQNASINYGLTDFGGNASSIGNDLLDSTNRVGIVTKSNTAELWAGTTLGGTTGFATAIAFAPARTIITMRVYSPDSGIVVKLKVEDPTDGTKSVETDTRTTVANAWQTLSFNFATQATGTAALNYNFVYKKASVFFNFGVTGAVAGAKTYYFDDMIFAPAVAPLIDLPVNFQNASINYGLTDFGGNASSIGNDLLDSTNRVGIVTKSNTAELWAGTTLGGTTGFATAIAFAPARTIITMRVYSPDSGIVVKLKVEDPTDGTKSVETDTRTTVANAWQTLSFNFATQATGTAALNYNFVYKKASVFFNFGVTGAVAGAKTYYFDDMIFAPSVAPLIDLPVNFQNASINYGLTDFGGNASSIVSDSLVAGNKVCKVIKTNTAELWAGTTLGGTTGFATAIAFAPARTIITMRVYSPDSGIVVKLKVEDPTDGTKSVETDTRTTVANAWQTLSFNFATQATGTAALNYNFVYKKASVFFNFGVTGAVAGAKTYYFDDMIFAPSVAPLIDLPVNFQNASINYGLTDFGGNASSIGNDLLDSTNRVGIVTKSNTAELWAGTTLGGTTGFATAIAFAPARTIITMRVYSPDSGIVVKLKVEDPTDGTKSVETDTRTTVANAWQTLSFNFATQAIGTAALNYNFVYKKASVFFNFGVTGAVAGTKTYYFDDMIFAPSVAPLIDLPVDFQNASINYGLIDFGGNASSIVSDSLVAGNKVCKVIKTNTAELWAGTTLGGTVGFANAIPFTSTNTKMNIRVYAPAAGMPIRVKAEDPNDPTKSVETEALTRVANGWDTLEFNFANQANGTAAINYGYTYKKLSVFFNFGTTGAAAGEKVFYFDDVKFGGLNRPSTGSKVNVRFTVDTKGMQLAAGDTITLNGTFNGWCGACTKMTKIPGTKMWTTMIQLDADSTYEYKYVVGAWVSQEILNPALTACTKTTGNFTNRVYTASKSNDSIPMVCWESCVSCEKTAPKAKVTFKVNMKNYLDDSLSIKGVTLNGSFNGWCGECNKMTNLGNDVWATTLTLDTGSYDYKFTVGNWLDQEQFNSSDPCVRTVGNFSNRFVNVTDTTSLNLSTYCWNTCNVCEPVGLNELLLNTVKVYPNPAKNSLYVDLGEQLNESLTNFTIYNILGEQVVFNQATQTLGITQLDISNLKSGLYILKIEIDGFSKNVKFQVN